ncbi:MAG: hypothetical protein ABJE95_19630 [Byssovorax sp.]
MGITFKIQSGTGRTATNAAGVVMRVGICSAVALAGVLGNAPADLADGQDGTPQIGYGPLAIADARAAADSGAARYAYKIPATTAGTISAVTETPAGTGPTIAVAGSLLDGLTTPYLACSPRVKVIAAGVVGTAKVSINLDGGVEYPYQYLFDVPAEAPAILDGTVDLTGITLSTLNTLHVKLTADTGGAQNLALTTPADLTALLAQLNGGITNVTFSLVGGKYLRMTSATPGTAGTITVDATGLAAAALGFTSGASNLVGTGSPSTITIPGTGLVLTFPATSAYVLDTVYSFTTTAPRHTQAALDTALAAINNDSSLAFGLVVVVQEPADATELKSYTQDLISTKLAWETQPNKRFVTFLLAAPISASDASIKSTMQGQAIGRGVCVTAGDTYETSAAPSPIGSFRVAPVGPLSIVCASQSLSEDPGFGGFGPLPACKTKSPDGVTLARDEYTAAIKLGTSSGPGFTTVCAQGGLPHFTRGVTRAGAANLFVDLGVSRMVDEASRLLFAGLQKVANLTLDLNEDGTIDEADAAAYELVFDGILAQGIVKQKHASRAFTTIDRAADITQTRALTLTFTLQERGQGEDITATLNLVGTISVT